jgi:tRNA pseudouridine38-40 synthase
MKTRNLKLTIEYDGTDFNGWQIQAGKNRTVQGELEKALRQIFKKKIRITGSGRTDSGVHALAQVAHFKCASRLDDGEIRRALNANLPKDVVVLDVRTVADSFHSQFSTKRKTYQYTILNRVCPCAINRRFCVHIPQALDLALMRREAKHIVGKKDFRSFMATDRAKRERERLKDTVRRIYRLDIAREGDYITITIESDGFLYKMVRNIVGTLIEIGKNKLAQGAVTHLLKKKDRKFAAKTAPAHGLCLVSVKY